METQLIWSLISKQKVKKKEEESKYQAGGEEGKCIEAYVIDKMSSVIQIQVSHFCKEDQRYQEITSIHFACWNPVFAFVCLTLTH